MEFTDDALNDVRLSVYRKANDAAIKVLTALDEQFDRRDVAYVATLDVRFRSGRVSEGDSNRSYFTMDIWFAGPIADLRDANMASALATLRRWSTDLAAELTKSHQMLLDGIKIRPQSSDVLVEIKLSKGIGPNIGSDKANV